MPDKDTTPCKLCGHVRRRDRSGRYIKRVKLSREYRKALTIISRDLDYLMQYSNTRPLSDEESTALRGYAKFLRELTRDEQEKAGIIPQENLSELAVDPNSTK